MKKILIFLLIPFLFACTIKNIPLPVSSLDKGAIELTKKEKGYWIEVQVAQRKLVLAKSDHIIKTFPIAVGMPDYPSPTGLRKINSVIWNPWWYPPKASDWVEDPTPVPPRTNENPLGEIKMSLGKDSYLIHGTKAVQSIGNWASHGCFRMLFEDVFGLVQLLLTEYSKVSAVEQMEKANQDTNTEFATPLTREVPVVLTYEPVKVGNGYVTISPDFYKRIPDMPQHVADVVTPYLKKDRTPNLKKIKALFKIFKSRTIHVSLDQVSS